jgi:VCBS repeat-containing protein
MYDETARTTGSDSDSVRMGLEIASTAAVAARTGAVPLIANADNVIVLPAGASLDDIAVEGRDLVIRMDDGRVFVIPDGAIFVPQIVVDGVAVPPLNLAALLIGQQPEPAAGTVSSSGGNFADPNAPIQDAFGLGDLLPYTELAFPEQPEREVIPDRINNLPTTIIITPNNPAGAVAASATVNEKGLPPRGAMPPGSGEIADGNATNNSDTTETTTGTIDITSLDGVRSITINGTAVTTVGQTIAGASGTLTITSIDLVGQTVGYSYTLTTNTSGDNTTDNFAVTVTDNDGDVASATLTVNIIDDVPTARPDSNSVVEGATVTGAVLPNDTSGADNYVPAGGVVGVRAAGNDTTSAVTTGVGTQIAGLYGTLTLQANGTYSYKANANAISANQQDVFVYTIRDGDGDQSTTTLTINLSAVNLAADNQVRTVNEAALDTTVTAPDLGAGSITGSTPSSTAETVTGQLAVPGATSYTAQTVTTTYGLFRLNADGSYTYTLTRPFTTNPAADNGAQTVNGVEVFTYTGQDANGNTVSGTITINIIDDIPIARADSGSVTEGQTLTVAAASGVLVNDTAGADGYNAGGSVVGVRAAGGNTTTPVTTGVGTSIAGQYGTLTLNADGSYTYKSNANSISTNQQDVFVYTIRDGDGDQSTTTLTINIGDVTLRPDNQVRTVNEAGLDTANDAGPDTVAGTVNGSNPSSDSDVATGALAVAGATSYTLTSSATGTYGTLAFNSNGTYTYTLTKPFDTSPDADNGTNTETGKDVFTYTATDAGGVDDLGHHHHQHHRRCAEHHGRWASARPDCRRDRPYDQRDPGLCLGLHREFRRRRTGGGGQRDLCAGGRGGPVRPHRCRHRPGGQPVDERRDGRRPHRDRQPARLHRHGRRLGPGDA